MKTQKVYVLTKEWVQDGQRSAAYESPILGVYSDDVMAMEAFDTVKEETMAEFGYRYDRTENVKNDELISFSAWDDSCYDDEHFVLELTSIEMNTPIVPSYQSLIRRARA